MDRNQKEAGDDAVSLRTKRVDYIGFSYYMSNRFFKQNPGNSLSMLAAKPNACGEKSLFSRIGLGLSISIH